VEQRTGEHLETAERNRDLARLLLAPSMAASLSTHGFRQPPYEWVAVIVFYAAVHYVNAYLWERLRLEPNDHG
jgi:hypothetical protein